VLFEAEVPADLRDELSAAIEEAGEPEDDEAAE
jgi:hypothetical protein